MEQNKMNEINGGAQEENALAGQEKKSLPMIALRGKVVFPKTFISFDVGRQISLAAVNAAAENGTEVFIAAQKNALVDTPSKNDLNRYGVVARVTQIIKLPKRSAKIISAKTERKRKLISALLGRRCWNIRFSISRCPRTCSLNFRK